MLLRLDFAVGAVANTFALVVEGIEHRVVLAAGHKAAVVGHMEVFVVGRDNFVVEVALHADWVVTALRAPFRS